MFNPRLKLRFVLISCIYYDTLVKVYYIPYIRSVHVQVCMGLHVYALKVLVHTPSFTALFTTCRILNLSHEVDKSDVDILIACAQHLRRLAQVSAAAEVYEKMEDNKSLVALYVDTHQWENVSLRIRLNTYAGHVVCMQHVKNQCFV